VRRKLQYDEHYSFRQDSFCYLTQLDGELGVPALTEGEAEAGFRVERFDGFEQAIVAIEKGGQQVACAHMTVRDAALLRAARGV
jgi:hypothetical protein